MDSVQSFLAIRRGVSFELCLHVLVEFVQDPRFRGFLLLDFVHVEEVAVLFGLFLQIFEGGEVDEIAHAFVEFVVLGGGAGRGSAFGKGVGALGFAVAELSGWGKGYASKWLMMVSISAMGLRYFIFALWMTSLGDSMSSYRRMALRTISALLTPRCLGISFYFIRS